MVGNGKTWECVVLDLNTQFIFCDPAGARSVGNSGQLMANLALLLTWVKQQCVPVISSIDSHRSGEIDGRRVQEYCIDGSPGQRKLPFTILDTAVAVEGDNTLSVPLDLFNTHQQVVFRKRTQDLFGNPKADRFLTQLDVAEFIICGVGLECSVRTMALGLLGRGRKVTIVYDACGYWTPPDGELALRQLLAKGADIVGIDQLCQRRPKLPFAYDESLPPYAEAHGSTLCDGKRPANGTNGQRGSNGRSGPNGQRGSNGRVVTNGRPKEDGKAGQSAS